MTAGSSRYFNVFTYRFDLKVMDATALHKRLPFKTGGAWVAFIVVTSRASVAASVRPVRKAQTT